MGSRLSGAGSICGCYRLVCDIWSEDGLTSCRQPDVCDWRKDSFAGVVQIELFLAVLITVMQFVAAGTVMRARRVGLGQTKKIVACFERQNKSWFGN